MIKVPEDGKEFPREITMKVVYRNINAITVSIKTCLDANNIKHSLQEKTSSSAKFISFTVIGKFEDEKELNSVCTALKSIEGFMMMF